MKEPRFSFASCLMATILVFALAFLGCSNSSDSSGAGNVPNGNPSGSGPNAGGTAFGPGTNPSGGGSQNPLSGGPGSSATSSSATLNVTYGKNVSDTKLASVTWKSTVYLDLSNSKYSPDGSEWTAISTDASSPSQAATNVTVYKDSGYIKIDTSETSDAVKFVLSGSLTGELFFANKKGGVIGLFMEGATINSGGYPCIEFDKKSTAYLVLSGENALKDGRTYGTDYSGTSSKKGTLSVKGDLNISATDSTASLTVTNGFKHGLYSSQVINFYGGIVTVNSTGRNGFQAVNGFNMYGGTAIVYGSGTNTNNESRGIVVEGEEGDDGKGLGFFNMTGGAVNIKCVSKGITAKWDSDSEASGGDATDSDTSNDPNPVVTITGGTVNIITYGTPKDESSSASTFTDADGATVSEKTKLSPEGIEGKAGVTITGGTINVCTTDDCINSSNGNIEISGGNIYAYSSANDSIDSNGKLTISGGTIVALTATNPECAFDCDNNTFAITGGTLIGIGTNNYSSPTPSACKQSVIVVSGNYLGSGGSTFALEDSSGAAVFAFTIPSEIYSSLSSNNVAIFSSPNISAGESYSLYSGVTVSGGAEANGLYTMIPTVTGGTSSLTEISTSTSGYVYTKSSGSNGGNRPF